MDSGDSPDAVSPGTGSTAARSISTVGEGQVCDRCRQKKIKCDGLVPNCTNCVTASAQCIVSAQLRRKTKLRGFKASSLAQAQDLRDENESLRRRLATLEEANSSLTEQIQEVLNQTSPEGNDGHARTGLVAPPPSGLLIKHMGRLVQDSLGVSRFAGSTTGVHFVLSVQQTLRSKMLAMENFPESIFTLHLVPCTSHHLLTRDSTMAMGTATPGLASRFSHPLSYYLKQIRLFSTCWSCICPVVVTGDLSRHLAAALDRAHRGMPPRIEEDNLMFCQIALITLINSITVIPGSPLSISDQDSHNYMTVVNSVLPQLMIRGDLLSLQALVLLSLYIQFTGRHQSMAHINGILVQLGQSLGLHRHTRRFKFSAGENEIRRRIWWWIYLFDKMTAISHGLPKLINDSDLDADYPVDCELEHIDTAQLLFPLPGETTQVRDFIALVHLSRVFSGILDQLYTTTHRREGPAKMAKLSGELRSWNQQFANQLGATINSDGLLISGVTAFKGSQEEPVARIWLPLMSNIALMLIYRPGLTFGEEAAEFEESLRACATASTAIVEAISILVPHPIALGISPPGPSLIFQCSLIHILLWTHFSESSAPPGISLESSFDLVRRAAAVLTQGFLISPGGQNNNYWRTPEPTTAAISECLGLLDSLSQAALRTQSIVTEQETSLLHPWDDTLALAHAPQNSHPSHPSKDGLAVFDDAALQDLNQLDGLEFFLDNPFDMFQ